MARAARQETSSNDGWQSLPIQCKGGLVLNVDALTQGTNGIGTAKILQNFECALEGGYRRINGYTKWDTNTVPGTTSNPILGVKAALGGVFAARRVTATPTTDIYFSSGSGWGSRINSSNRGGNPTKVRMHEYYLGAAKIAGVDGVNPAFTWDGTTYTLINGTGAPTNPAYVDFFLNRVVLAGYSSNPSAFILTAPNSDTDCTAAAGAIEISAGDVITGIKQFRNQLYIFTKNTISKLVGNSSANFELEPVTTEIGCIAGDTIQEIGGDLIYLAPDGFRSVAGTYNIGDVDLSLQSRNIQPIIRTNILNNTGISQYVSFPVRKKSQYRCLFYDTTASKANSLGVIGKIEQGNPTDAFNNIYTTYAWSITIGIQAYSGDSFFDGANERIVIGDASNGIVYQLESGNDFDGTAIQAVYQSPSMTFQDATLRKVLQKATVYTQFEGTATVNLGVLFDFQEAGVIQPQANSLALTGSFPTYGSALYDTDVYGSLSFPVFRQNLIGSGFTAAFNYASNGGAPYRIDSYQVQFSTKGRR